MIVTSQLLIQTTKNFNSLSDVQLRPPTLKKVPPPMVVTTTYLMFRKLFDLWWFDKLHVEMGL